MTYSWHRALGVVLALCMLAACAADREIAEQRRQTPPTGAPSVVETAPGGSTPVSLPSDARPPTTARSRGTLVTDTPTPGQVPSRDTPVPDGEDPVVAAGEGPPGSLARALLQPRPARRDVLEVLQQPDAAPQRATLSRAVASLTEVSGKAVTLAGPIALPGGPRGWTPQALRDLADSSGRARQGGDQAVVRLLFLEGEFEPNRDVLGATVRGDVIALFPDVIRGSASPVVPSARIEEAVMLHELGHVLGLVDLVVDRNRDDPEHPSHSTNPESVMYWAVELSLVGQVLGGPPPTDFDAADRADLAAIRNGA